MFLEFLSLVDTFHLQLEIKLEIKTKEHYSSLVFHNNKAYVSEWTDFQVIHIYSEVLARRYF